MPPQFSVFIAVSVDGYIARPDGALDWLSRVEQPGEDYGYAEFMSSVDTLVLGRNTYDTVLGFGDWPYEGKRCVVVTHQQGAAAHGERYFAGQVADLAPSLFADGARRVYVDGGQVIRQFLAADLLDDLTLSVIPVLLGSGISLFSPTNLADSKELGLDLKSVRAFPSGLVQLKYQRRRAGSGPALTAGAAVDRALKLG